MTKFLLIFILATISISFFGQSTEQSRGARTLVSAESSEKGTTRAVIIGISDYYSENLKLKYADNDAILFYLFLLNNEYINIEPNNIKLLLNKDATVDNILTKLDWLKKNASTNDQTIIYYAGHADVVKIEENESGFFLTHFASDQREYRAGGAIPFSHVELVTDTIALKGSKVWLITDACRSGTIINETGAKLSLTALNANFNKTLKIVSSKPTQFSYEFDEIKHGIFTYYLVQALMGKADNAPQDSEMTADEIRDFMRKNVKTYTGKRQTPSLYTDDDDEILALSNPIFLDIPTEKIDMLKAVYSEKVAGMFELDLAFKSGELTIEETQLANRFSKAINNNNLFGNDSSAVHHFHICKELGYNPVLHNVLKNNLINSLNSESQKTINSYLDAKNEDRAIDVLSYEQASQAISICLDLIESNNFNYNTILARKLFFDAYVIIKNKDYNKYTIAENKLLKSLKIIPNAAYTQNSLGELYQYWHNYPKAEYHLHKTIEAIPTWAKPHNDLGNVYQAQGNYKAAIAEYNKALKLDTSYTSVYNNIGNNYLELGQYNKAEEIYQHRLKLESTAKITLMNLGVLNNLRGRSELAEQYFIKAASIDSTYEVAFVKLGNHYLRNTGKTKLGLVYLQKALELEPQDPYCISELGDFYSYYVSDTSISKQAKSLYTKAIKIDPYYIWAYINMGWYYYNLKNYTEAEKYFQSAIDSIPYRANPYQQMAGYKRYRGLKDEAVHYYKTAIEVDPYHYASYEGYSRFMELSMDNTNEAEEILIKAFDLFENSPLVAKDLADFYYRTGDTLHAVEYYEKAKIIDSSFAYSYSSLALIYLNNKEFDLALSNFKKAVSLNPHQLDLSRFIKNIQNRAISLLSTDMEGAALGFTTIFGEDPNNLFALKNLAKIYYLSNQPKVALPYIEKCLGTKGLSYNQEKSYLHLKGLILIDLKKYDEALDIFENIIEKSPMPTYFEKCVALYLLKKNDQALIFYKREKDFPYSKINSNTLNKYYSSNFIKQLNKLDKLANK